MWRSPSGLRSRLCCQQFLEKGCGSRMRIAGCAAEAEPAGAAHCGVERRQTTIVLDVEFGPTICQKSHDLVVALNRRAVQGRLTASVDCVDVHAGIEANLDR